MKRMALAAGGLALALALTGCGSRTAGGTVSGDPALFDNAQELVRAATSSTDQAKTAKFQMVATINGQTTQSTGSRRFDGADSAMQMSTDLGTLHNEFLFVDKAVYMQVPEDLRAQLTGGKPWGKADPGSDLAKVLGAGANVKQNDPSNYLQQIQQAGSITRSEQTTLNGAPVTHYWISLDPAKVADRLSKLGFPQDTVDKLKAQKGTIPVEVWLDRDLLPAKIFENLSAQTGGTQAGTMTITYSDWGAPVTITAPPPDQVGALKLPN